MTTVTTYNLSLKSNTATMWIDSKPDDQGYIDVSLGLNVGEAEVTTSSKVKVLAPKTEVIEAVDSTPVKTFSEEEKSYYCAQIRSMLDRFDIVETKDERATLAEELLEYLRTTGLEFTKHYNNFKTVVIRKCYELKLLHPDLPSVVSKSNQLLTALGETLNVPDSAIQEFYCKGCAKYHPHSLPHTPKPVTAPSVTPVAPIATIAPVTTSSEFYNADKTLFLTIAKRLDCKTIINNPDRYFGYYQTPVTNGPLKGHLVAERMENYITSWFHSNEGDNGRAKTMKRLFANNKLTYTDDVMPLYSEWLKTYIIFLGRSNRYQKMVCFIELHKHLFSNTF